MLKDKMLFFPYGLICFLLLLAAITGSAQIKNSFSRQDSLRGGYGPGRDDWDLMQYDLTFRIDPDEKQITGLNKIRYIDKGVRRLQLDLQEPLSIDSIIWMHQGAGRQLPFFREGNAWHVAADITKNDFNPLKEIWVYYHGKVRVAVKPPWDGGWVFTRDKNGNPWMSVACQSLGASVWYPCKDSQRDEPDSGAIVRIEVPDTLVAVGNGRLIHVTIDGPGRKIYSWKVRNPINNYNLIAYIGKYVHFDEKYSGEKGSLDLDYWVLDYHREKAEKQFMQVPGMLKSFEYWFGPYPFYEDGYKLVEAPYLGMEHQSAIAYGNGFRQGYLGTDRSGTGIGKRFDFIIIHESGHEWFGNSITANDIADLWIHEGFTTYAEALYVESQWNKADAFRYSRGQNDEIDNNSPCIGQYGVQDDPSSRSIDVYPKAAAMIHTIRQIVQDDDRFRNMLRKMNVAFYHSTVTSAEIEAFMAGELRISRSIFDQYLRTVMIPDLQVKTRKKGFSYKWGNVVKGFDMPVDVRTADKQFRLYPSDKSWKKKRIGKSFNGIVSADENYLIKTKIVK